MTDLQSALLRHIYGPFAVQAFDLVTARKIFPTYKWLRRTQWLSVDAMMSLQRTQLQSLLVHAWTYSPFYRVRLEEAGWAPGIQPHDPLEFLPGIPPLTKQDLQRNLDRISTVRKWNAGKLVEWSTGGSTGSPTRLLIDVRSRDRRQAVQFRNAEWLGVRPGDPITILGGSSLGISSGSSRLARIEALAKRQRHLGAWNLDPDTLTEYGNELERQKPRLLVGYGSALYQLADHLVRTGRTIQIPAVLSTAEMLLPKWARTIEQAFDSPTHNRYGSIEVGDIAHSCASCGEMHVNEENVILEQEESTGDLLVTDLTTFATPMIRYRIGDQVSFRPGPAPCGRGLGTVLEIHGRSGEVLELPGGKRVSSMVFAFTPGDTVGVRDYQIWQPSQGELQVLLVSDGDEPGVQVLQELAQQFPQVEIEVFRVPTISPLKSGKRPLIVKGRSYNGQILSAIRTS